MIKKYQVFRTLSARILCCVLLGSALAAGAWVFSGEEELPGYILSENGVELLPQAVKPHDFQAAPKWRS